MSLPAADLHLREAEGGKHFWEGRWGVGWGGLGGGKGSGDVGREWWKSQHHFQSANSIRISGLRWRAGLPPPSLFFSPPPPPPAQACDCQKADVMTREAAVWVPLEFQPSATTDCVWLLFVSLHVRR